MTKALNFVPRSRPRRRLPSLRNTEKTRVWKRPKTKAWKLQTDILSVRWQIDNTIIWTTRGTSMLKWNSTVSCHLITSRWPFSDITYALISAVITERFTLPKTTQVLLQCAKKHLPHKSILIAFWTVMWLTRFISECRPCMLYLTVHSKSQSGLSVQWILNTDHDVC